MPQLRAVPRIAKQGRDDLLRVDDWDLDRDALLSREVSRQHARVVTVALHGARVARDAVFHHSLGALIDRAREVDAGHADALPEVGLGGKPALSERGHPKLGEIAKRRCKTRGGDHVVDHELQRAILLRADVHIQALGHLPDLLDGSVEYDHAARQHGILDGLDVACADAHKRVRVDRELGAARRSQDDLARPREQTRGDLEA